MDPVSVAKHAYSLLREVQKRVQTVGANKHKCQMLVSRMGVIEEALCDTAVRPSLQPPAVRRLPSALRRCVQEDSNDASRLTHADGEAEIRCGQAFSPARSLHGGERVLTAQGWAVLVHAHSVNAPLQIHAVVEEGQLPSKDNARTLVRLKAWGIAIASCNSRASQLDALGQRLTCVVHPSRLSVRTLSRYFACCHAQDCDRRSQFRPLCRPERGAPAGYSALSAQRTLRRRRPRSAQRRGEHQLRRRPSAMDAPLQDLAGRMDEWRRAVRPLSAPGHSPLHISLKIALPPPGGRGRKGSLGPAE